MDKKPVRRSPYIVKLSRDHHAGLLFCWKIRQGFRLGVPVDRMKPYVAYFFEHLLTPHFIEEEQILFAPAAKDKFIVRAAREHENIRQVCAEIGKSGGSSLDPLLQKLALDVDEHIRFEERTLFPHLEQTLAIAQLESICKQLDHEPAKDDYSDTFWVQSKS